MRLCIIVDRWKIITMNCNIPLIGRQPIRQRPFLQPNTRERAPRSKTKGTWLKGTQLRLNSVDPAVFTHTGGARGLVRVLSVSSSSRSLTPHYALSTVSTSYPVFPSPIFLPSSLSRARFKRDFIWSFWFFNSFFFSFLFFPFRTSPRHSLYRCLPHLLVTEGKERGDGEDLEREEPKSPVVATWWRRRRQRRWRGRKKGKVEAENRTAHKGT